MDTKIASETAKCMFPLVLIYDNIDAYHKFAEENSIAIKISPEDTGIIPPRYLLLPFLLSRIKDSRTINRDLISRYVPKYLIQIQSFPVLDIALPSAYVTSATVEKVYEKQLFTKKKVKYYVLTITSKYAPYSTVSGQYIYKTVTYTQKIIPVFSSTTITGIGKSLTKAFDMVFLKNIIRISDIAKANILLNAEKGVPVYVGGVPLNLYERVRELLRAKLEYYPRGTIPYKKYLFIRKVIKTCRIVETTYGDKIVAFLPRPYGIEAIRENVRVEYPISGRVEEVSTPYTLRLTVSDPLCIVKSVKFRYIDGVTQIFYGTILDKYLVIEFIRKGTSIFAFMSK
ncbi:MAG: hypothetical protein GXO26_03705 [Crenarchaeota archaeon]|nr:hypothetical protein [Thermoproteota archaeon]